MVNERGKAIDKADVRLEAFYRYTAGTFSGNRKFSGETNHKGEWTVGALQPGIWLFEVIAPGYVPETVVLPIRVLTTVSMGTSGMALTWDLILKPVTAPDNVQGELLTQAASAARDGNLKAVRTALRVIPEDPGSDFLAAAARIAMVARDMPLARTLFMRALERDPTSYRAALGIASMFLLKHHSTARRAPSTRHAAARTTRTNRSSSASPSVISPRSRSGNLSGMNTKRSVVSFARAQQILPGGVDSPVRAFKWSAGRRSSSGAPRARRIEDVDGNTYIDYVMSWGPLIHGHAPRGLVKAIGAAARDGTSFGAPSPLEVELGERVRALMPSLERVRFVSSGTEAAMSAVRVARAATGRDRIIKFEGCYHGHADAFLVKAGSGALTLGTPTSPGVTRGGVGGHAGRALQRPRLGAALFDANRDQIAAVIVEPIAGNMGVVPPADGFLRALRDALHAPRRAADLRRGHFRLPRRGRRRAGALRRPAGSHLSRQDHRRRASGGRVRRPRRSDGAGLAGRARSIRPARCRAIRWR